MRAQGKIFFTFERDTIHECAGAGCGLRAAKPSLAACLASKGRALVAACSQALDHFNPEQPGADYGAAGGHHHTAGGGGVAARGGCAGGIGFGMEE